MIKEFCYSLAEKRKAEGFTVEEIVDKTKLCPSVIRDIEKASLEKINPTYLKGFIKIYSSVLGMEINEATLEELAVFNPSKVSARRFQKKTSFTPLKIFNGNRKPAVQPIPCNLEPPAPLEKGKPPIKNKPVKATVGREIQLAVKKNAILILLGIIGVVILVNLIKFTAGKIYQAVKMSPAKVVVGSSVRQKPAEEINLGELTAFLKVNRDCFIRVKVDGKLLFEGILNKGTVETWKGKEEIEFKISDGSAVYLEVNGKAIPALTSMRKPIKSLKITPSGISVDK